MTQEINIKKKLTMKLKVRERERKESYLIVICERVD